MSETKQFDVPQVLAALEAAVAERGKDYVYENEAGNRKDCLYVHHRGEVNEQPGCIAGQVYFDLTGKLVPSELEVGLVDFGPTDEWVEDGTFTLDALRVLGAAQIHQDDGKPWGIALHEARCVAHDLEMEKNDGEGE